jgi:peptide/nickel transport system permease protein
MVAEASQNIGQQPWLLIPSGGVIITVVLALGLVGDGVRDAISDHRGSAPPTRTRADAAATRRDPQPEPPPDATAGASQRPLLQVRSMTIAVAGTRHTDADQSTVLVDQVSFDVARREALGIVGESGCGKSMTMRGVLGLLPPACTLTSGSVRFDDVELTALDDRARRRMLGSRIAWIGQDPAALLDPCFTVGDQLREIVRTHTHRGGKAAAERAAELLALVQLSDRVARMYPHQLSGGMAQRVCIAAALAGEPDLIIADEPTTALDVTVQAEILALLADLRQRLDVTLILVSHDWGVLADSCDRVMTMYAGQLVEVAPLDVLAGAAHPYTAALLAAAPTLDGSGEALATIPGQVAGPGEYQVGCRFAPRCGRRTSECVEAPIQLTALVPDPTQADGTGHLCRCLHPLTSGAGADRSEAGLPR